MVMTTPDVKLRVRQLAEAQNISITELTKKTGLAPMTVRGMWHDFTERLDRQTLAKIAQALGVEPHELFVREQGDNHG